MQMQIQTFTEQTGKHIQNVRHRLGNGRGQAVSDSVTGAESDDKKTERYFAVIVCVQSPSILGVVIRDRCVIVISMNL